MVKKRRSCKLLAAITGYSTKHISKLRMKGLTDQQIAHETTHYNRQYRLNDKMLTIKQLADELGYSISGMGYRLRTMSEEEALKHAGNNHAKKGGWDDLPKRTFAECERILREIPGPTRFDEMYG
jgi:hypothetical protein